VAPTIWAIRNPNTFAGLMPAVVFAAPRSPGSRGKLGGLIAGLLMVADKIIPFSAMVA